MVDSHIDLHNKSPTNNFLNSPINNAYLWKASIHTMVQRIKTSSNLNLYMTTLILILLTTPIALLQTFYIETNPK